MHLNSFAHQRFYAVVLNSNWYLWRCSLQKVNNDNPVEVPFIQVDRSIEEVGVEYTAS